MRRASKLLFGFTVVSLSFSTLVARAVPPQPGLQRNSLTVKSSGNRYRPQRPTVSPYLALIPGGLGNLAAINYFNVVKPELAQMQINEQQGNEIQKLETAKLGGMIAGEEDENAKVRQSAAFMTHAKYFGQPINRTALQKPDKK